MKKLKVLAIETSTNLGGVSFLEDNLCVFSKSSTAQKSHSELVHQFIESGLNELNWSLNEIDLFATTSGPGSFTGIRVAVNTCKTYSYIFKKPLVGVDSLNTLALQNLPLIKQEGNSSNKIFCAINAYKNMVYYSQYEVIDDKLLPSSLKLIQGPSVIPVKDLAAVIKEKTWFLGDGFATYEKYFSTEVKEYLLRNTSLQDFPSSTTLGQLAFDKLTSSQQTFEWNLFTPLYLRASEAEENKKGILYSPL